MNNITLANVLYVVVFVGTLIAEHFNLVPSGTGNLVLGAVSGFAVGTGTLIPRAKASTSVPVQPVPPSNGDLTRG